MPEMVEPKLASPKRYFMTDSRYALIAESRSISLVGTDEYVYPIKKKGCVKNSRNMLTWTVTTNILLMKIRPNSREFRSLDETLLQIVLIRL